MRQYRLGTPFVSAAVVAVLLASCTEMRRPIHYLGEPEGDYYKEAATEIAHPCLECGVPSEATSTLPPRTLEDLNPGEIWDLSLVEALHTAMLNSRVIRTGSINVAASAPSEINPLLRSPEATATVYDPAIQETGVLFGRRGVEAALADFDANLTTSMIWGRDEDIQNNIFFGGGLLPGSTLVSETGQFNAALNKQLGYGGSFTLFHAWNYLGSNVPGQLFPSSYRGVIGGEYRHPLLAGAGTEFTRIAGPITRSFGGITGVTQGVVIARINQDMSLADFETNVRNMLFDVEKRYWDLYKTYRFYDTAIAARNSALRTWREAKAKLDVGGVANFKPADEAQARDQYFQTRSLTQQSLAALYKAEVDLRRIMGLPVSDGRIIRPSDEPTTARFIPDWESSLAEALTERVELRKQKWQIKSLELQLRAARSLVRPRMDFVSRYRVNGFGDVLLGNNDDDGVTAQGLHSAYETITQGNQTGWDLGVEFTMPLGLRSAHAQVRNIELQLARAREILAAQELDVSHELATVMHNLAEMHARARSNYNRWEAARRRVELFEAEFQAGTATLDPVLRAQESRAQAEAEYYNTLVEYNKEIANWHFRKGTLLEHNNVFLAEGAWTPAAYHDAYRRALARSHAFNARFMHTEPEEFQQDSFVRPGLPPALPPAPNDAPPAPEPAPPEPPGAPVPPAPADRPADPEPAVAPTPPPSAAEVTVRPEFPRKERRLSRATGESDGKIDDLPVPPRLEPLD